MYCILIIYLKLSCLLISFPLCKLFFMVFIKIYERNKKDKVSKGLLAL